jgi:DNA-binding transcriptional MocR family regulator
VEEQISLAIESLRERQESQLINNDDYGLLKNVADSQRIQTRNGTPSKDNIVFVRGTTEGINLVAQAYVKPMLKAGDEIIVSLLEHHANIVPWQLVAQETGAVIKVVPIDESGQIILSEYEKLFTNRTKFVSVTHVSNVLGTITPVEELVAIAHRHGVRILIDGAHHLQSSTQQIRGRHRKHSRRSRPWCSPRLPHQNRHDGN